MEDKIIVDLSGTKKKAGKIKEQILGVVFRETNFNVWHAFHRDASM